jgi:hypothetical protein
MVRCEGPGSSEAESGGTVPTSVRRKTRLTTAPTTGSGVVFGDDHDLPLNKLNSDLRVNFLMHSEYASDGTLHNDGHGKQNLSVVFAMLMMLAFLVDQPQQHSCPLFQANLKNAGSRRLLWERLRSHSCHFVFQSMRELLEAMLHDRVKEMPCRRGIPVTGCVPVIRPGVSRATEHPPHRELLLPSRRGGRRQNLSTTHARFLRVARQAAAYRAGASGCRLESLWPINSRRFS